MKIKLHYFFIMLALLAGIHQASAQGTTAFTYQGQLHDGGTNANGTYTMMFALYDAASSSNQIGSTITTSPTLANGLFSVNLDFGAGAFTGNARWLDITITNGGTTQTLSPRVQVLPAPYAVYSSSAASAANLTSGSWSAGVGNYQTSSNVFLLFANGSLVMGMSTNGVYMGHDLQINGNLNVGGNLTGGGISPIPQMQVFTANGSFVVPAGVTKVMVEVWGAGAGGGGGYYDTINNCCCQSGGGGGAGGYGKGTVSVTLGSTNVVIIGTGGVGGDAYRTNSGYYGSGTSGGDSGFGSLISATGGSPGTEGNANGVGSNGQGGDSSDALFHIQGGNGYYASGQGYGGAAGYGGSGGSNSSGGSGPGNFPGGGGGGSDCEASIGSAGANGLVIVYY